MATHIQRKTDLLCFFNEIVFVLLNPLEIYVTALNIYFGTLNPLLLDAGVKIIVCKYFFNFYFTAYI